MKWLRWLGYAVAGVVAIVVVAAGSIYVVSEVHFRRAYAIPPEQLPLRTDSVTLARGQHFAEAVAGCEDCHGPQLQGATVVDDPALGKVVSRNLTPGIGGIGTDLTPADIERAVRHGVGRDGHALRVMPSADFQHMSDSDMIAVISYVKALPPVANTPDPTHLQFLARALMVTGVLPLLPAEAILREPAQPEHISASPTAEYGHYLATVGGCYTCHGAGLSGGHIAVGPPSWPPGANLTPSGNLGKWTEAQFTQTLRTGKRPDGTPLNPVMPFRTFGKMTDAEAHALWLYLQSVPARPYGTH